MGPLSLCNIKTIVGRRVFFFFNLFIFFIHHNTVMHYVRYGSKKKLIERPRPVDQGLCCYCTQQGIAMSNIYHTHSYLENP